MLARLALVAWPTSLHHEQFSSSAIDRYAAVNLAYGGLRVGFSSAELDRHAIYARIWAAATRVDQRGGIRAVVVGGFNEHSAEVHRFVENAATTGASKMAMAGEMAFADARAKLRKEFRQRLSVGAWNDMFTHIFKRERFINPTPAAEAKLLGEKVARNAAFREVRVQAIKRRLDEGEALGSRAAAGRGTAAGEGSQANVEDGRVAGSFILAGLVRTGAGGGSTGGAQGSRERAGTGGHGEQLSNDLSLKGGRLRANNYNFAPSHSTKLHSDNGTGDSGGTHSPQQRRQPERW